MRFANDRTAEVNGLVKALHRGIDDRDGCAVWVCSCACNPSSKFRVRGKELRKTLSCGCLSPQADRALMRRRRSLAVTEDGLFKCVPACPSANPSKLPLAA